MNSLPIVLREMRLIARRPWTYWTRTGVALAAVVASLFVFVNGPAQPTQQGLTLLVTLGIIALALALLSGLFLTADCLSEERREGTLGLLFLSTLKGYDVVLGKMFVNAGSAFLALLSILPILCLPLLLGGVTWAETGRVMLALLLSLILSLSIGMFVSAFNTESRKAFAGTLVALLLLCAIPMLIGLFCEEFFRWPLRDVWVSKFSPIFAFMHGFERHYFGGVASIPPYWQSIALITITVTALLWTACLIVRSSWQRAESHESSRPVTDHSPRPAHSSERRVRLPGFHIHATDLYCWLSYRNSALGRGTRFFLILLAAFWLSMLLAAIGSSDGRQPFIISFFIAFGMHAIFKFIFALEATRQIHQDVRSGSMQLLLGTRLCDREIVVGQILAYQKRLNPWVWVLTGVNLTLELSVLVFSSSLHMSSKDAAVFSVFFLGGIVVLHLDNKAIQWVGIWQSLKARTHLRATFATIRTILGIPWIILPMLFSIAMSTRGSETAEVLAVLMICWFTFGCCLDVVLMGQARNNLRHRFRELASTHGQ